VSGGLFAKFKKSSPPPSQPSTPPSQTSNNNNSSGNSTTNPAASKDPFNIYYNNDKHTDEFDLSRIFTEDILRRPTKLFEFIISLKDECLLAAADLSNQASVNLHANIKSLFDNETSKTLRDRVFDEINRNIMPKEVRKHEDVVELSESSHERKLRHLILYGDCLVCCRLKKYDFFFFGIFELRRLPYDWYIYFNMGICVFFF
jgi:hypothetical protein